MVLADTGYWLALANAADKHHTLAVAVSADINSELVVTWPILTETCHLLGRRLGVRAQTSFLEHVQLVATLFELRSDHLPQCRRLMSKYADLPMDLADASLVIAAEELGRGEILSTDRRDLKTYRWKNRQPFKNLLFPED